MCSISYHILLQRRINVERVELDPHSNHLIKLPNKTLLTAIPPKCSIGNWTESFEDKGWSKCGEKNLLITGFYRSSPGSNGIDSINLLEEARCCRPIPAYSCQRGLCKEADWKYSK